jgi:hypothetical protein
LVVAVLANLRRGELAPQTPVPGQIRPGLRCVYTDGVLAATAVMMIVVFPTSYNFQISLALIASDTLAVTVRPMAL